MTLKESRGRSQVWLLHVHLVFTTKYRRKALTDEVLTRCEEIMRSVCEQCDAELQEFNGETNHVHLLVLYPPTVQISKLVNLLKGQSSRLLRQEFTSHLKRYLWGEHLWSPSYFAASVGGAPLSVLKAYIENQQRPD